MMGEDTMVTTKQVDDMSREMALQLHRGIEIGYTRYAWWKDGEQYVGSCGTTLSDALRKLDAEFGFRCLHRNVRPPNDNRCVRCGIEVEPVENDDGIR